MRIIIELTEDEARSTTIDRRTTGGRSEEVSERQEVLTSDGGSPSGQLLASLGGGGLAMSGVSGLTGGSGAGEINGGGTSNAGEPTGWMSLAMGETIE